MEEAQLDDNRSILRYAPYVLLKYLRTLVVHLCYTKVQQELKILQTCFNINHFGN